MKSISNGSQFLSQKIFHKTTHNVLCIQCAVREIRSFKTVECFQFQRPPRTILWLSEEILKSNTRYENDKSKYNYNNPPNIKK